MDFETGRLWASLADYYIRRGLFDKACDVFEEGITSVNTVHDFSLIFDAYAHFEESTLHAKLVIAREDGDGADATAVCSGTVMKACMSGKTRTITTRLSAPSCLGCSPQPPRRSTS